MQLLEEYCFFIAFKLTAKTLNDKPLVDYPIMAGYSYMLFFSSSQANKITTIYQPFCIATISTYGPGSYLILVDQYLFALSVSQDEQLRNMIKRSTLSESKFLHTIGTSAAERNKVILNSVMSKAKRQQ
jgi:hypothetical protein